MLGGHSHLIIEGINELSANGVICLYFWLCSSFSILNAILSPGGLVYILILNILECCIVRPDFRLSEV